MTIFIPIGLLLILGGLLLTFLTSLAGFLIIINERFEALGGMSIMVGVPAGLLTALAGIIWPLWSAFS